MAATMKSDGSNPKALQRLKEKYPECRITLLTSSLAGPLFESDPFLDEIIELMADKEEKSAIEVSKKYQIIFVPLNETNFMYAIATKSIDPIIMEPVFERIAKRIVKLVLDYKKEKSEN